MIIFCLLSMILNCNGLPYNDYKLKNKDFTTIINSKGISLSNKYNINYESFTEAKKYKKINFNEFEYNKEYSFSSVSCYQHDINTDNIKFIHEMTENNTKFINNMKRITKYEDNKLYVSIYIDNWKFNNKNNDLDFVFSIDTNYNFNNNSIIINNEFNIDFNENCIVDGYDERIYITKSNNKFKIHFPSFENRLYYQFIISKNNNNNNNFNLFIISVLCIATFLYYKFNY